VLECVVNVSEGRDPVVLEALSQAAGGLLLDLHSDAWHHRSVLTLGGPDAEQATRAVAATAVARIDISHHHGAHPRLGAADVVPFVPLQGSTLEDAIGARDRFAAWAGDELGVPCFLYGPERSLPEVRRQAFGELPPATGPSRPHPTAGAMCVGARGLLVAYNLWLSPGAELATARAIASELRGPAVRALGFELAGHVQVSCNLIDPIEMGPEEVYDAVAARTAIARAELVGLIPEAVLARVPEGRFDELDLSPSRTIEARLRRGSR
jgi:glutamate formiminotransferase / 5-formyltetrahydrofolate cyclo-ligase